MKKNLIIIVSMLSTLFSIAQKDEINLKDGTSIKCSIIEIDTSAKVFIYIAVADTAKSSISSTLVESYRKHEIINDKTRISLSKIKESFAESDDIYRSSTQDPIMPRTAGSHLSYFAGNAQVGLALMMAGTIITSVPWLITNNNPDNADTFANQQKTIAVVGAGISLVGYIVHFSSYSHARKAGKLMDISPELSLNITDSGIGLKFPINYK